MYDDNFDRDIDRDIRTIFYDETEVKAPSYNTKHRFRLTNSSKSMQDDYQTQETEDSKKASNLARSIAFASLMIFQFFISSSVRI